MEHFVFALHLHAFVFALFTLMLLLQKTGFANLLFLWIPVYVFLAMRRVYRQPLLKTGVKYVVLGWSYSALLTLAMAATAVVTLLLV